MDFTDDEIADNLLDTIGLVAADECDPDEDLEGWLAALWRLLEAGRLQGEATEEELRLLDEVGEGLWGGWPGHPRDG